MTAPTSITRLFWSMRMREKVPKALPVALSMIDKDWPKVKSRLEIWLRPENFDKNGQQYKSLREL